MILMFQTICHALEKADGEDAKFAEHDEVKEGLKSWKTVNESAPPTCR
jgi:hypothetical protein